MLIRFLGGEEKASLKMKSKEGWYDGQNGTNNSGFNALPGSARNRNGGFERTTKIGMMGMWWSATKVTNNYSASLFYLFFNGYTYDGTDNRLIGFNCGLGCSVRCVKD